MIDNGKTIKNKYTQQGVWGIFVGISDDSAGWLFYVPDARRTYIYMYISRCYIWWRFYFSSKYARSPISTANKKSW